MTFDRIIVDVDLMGGVPTLRGLRIPVATVVADGTSVPGILVDLSDLESADVAEALSLAAESVQKH